MNSSAGGVRLFASHYGNALQGRMKLVGWVRASASLCCADVLECDCFHEAILALQCRKAASGDLSGRDFGAGREESPEGCARGRKGDSPSAEFSSSRPAPKGREREYRPFINRALHESSGSCAMEGWMLAASTVFIIRVGRVENPIRAPDKRLNNSEQNLKMERSARALYTLMIGFRPWI